MTTTWPDLSNHDRAWTQAKQELGPDAMVREIAFRAEVIRRELEKDTLDRRSSI
jgi:hypothetical protein